MFLNSLKTLLRMHLIIYRLWTRNNDLWIHIMTIFGNMYVLDFPSLKPPTFEEWCVLPGTPKTVPELGQLAPRSVYILDNLFGWRPGNPSSFTFATIEFVHALPRAGTQ